MTHKVRLWDEMGTAFVVPTKTGITYTNQAGGTLCLHPEIEGFVVPFGNDLREQTKALELISIVPELTKAFENHTGSLVPGICDELDSIFDQAAKSWAPWASVSVDRNRQLDSFESWVFCRVDLSEIVSDVGSVTAVLTWPNSD